MHGPEAIGRHDSRPSGPRPARPPPDQDLDRLEVRRVESEVWIEAAARSFLHHQVRNLVGTLHFVGVGKWVPEQVSAVLAARDRRAGPTAPRRSYLTGVDYDLPVGSS